MYDNLSLWKERIGMADSTYSAIPNRLENVREICTRDTGEVVTQGALSGLSVTIHVGGIRVFGSLAKYLEGGNVYTLSRKSTQEAVEKLSEALGIDMKDSKVRSMEFGEAFVMQQPVKEYLKRLGDMPSMLRNEHDALYYTTRGTGDSKSFKFYDKIRELRTHKEPLPDALKNQNVLRYEMKIKGKLPRKLNVAEVNLCTLYERGFYRMLVNLWQQYYFSINKQRRFRVEALSSVKTPKQAVSALMALLISQTDKTQLSNFNDDVRQVLDRGKMLRYKKSLEQIASLQGFTEKDPLILELDDHIKNVGLYL